MFRVEGEPTDEENDDDVDHFDETERAGLCESERGKKWKETVRKDVYLGNPAAQKDGDIMIMFMLLLF